MPPAGEEENKAQHPLTHRNTESFITKKMWASAGSGYVPYILMQHFELSQRMSMFIISQSVLNR